MKRKRFSVEQVVAVQAQAVATLRRESRAAAAAFVVDDDEPYLTGRLYLAPLPLSYRAPDQRVHLNSVGLFQDYDSWITPLLPEIVQGQSYCHLPTAEYLIALATDAMEAGTVVTTDDAAKVRPKESN